MFSLNNIEQTTSKKALIILNLILLSIWSVGIYKLTQYQKKSQNFVQYHKEIHNNLYQANKTFTRYYLQFQATNNQIYWDKFSEYLTLSENLEREISTIKNNIYKKLDFYKLILAFLSVTLYFVCPPFRLITNILLTLGATFWTIDKIKNNN